VFGPHEAIWNEVVAAVKPESPSASLPSAGPRLKIAVVVQGRFHAFDLARALVARHHEVAVFTNYPRWVARRCGLIGARVHSYASHGVASRLMSHIGGATLKRRWEPVSHRMFGRWAARELSRESWDVIHCWSGVSEEILDAAVSRRSLTVLMRGSSHIVTQRRLLDEEERRTGVPLDKPSDWMLQRELREYQRCDRVLVLSSFAESTFRDHGERPVAVLPLGVSVEAFAPPTEVIAQRLARIREGAPLTVLFVGALLYRKGIHDLVQVIRALDTRRFRFLLVGGEAEETREILATLPDHVELTGHVPQSQLPAAYARGDIFLFPTIEDGFPIVLAQAAASRLPIVTTRHGAGVDLVTEDRNGWIVPVRDHRAITERLEWCLEHRDRLATMIEADVASRVSRTWDHVAADFEAICLRSSSSAAAPARAAAR